MVLRLILIGAAAVLAYALLSALDGESALADEGRARGRTGDGLLATTLDRTVAGVPSLGGPSIPGTPRERPAPPAPPTAPSVVETVGKVTVPVTTRARAVTERAVEIIENVRPARNLPHPQTPPDQTPDPSGAVPDAVSDVVGVVPGVVGSVPDVVGVVPGVVGVVPGVVGVVPEVIGSVPDVVAVVPRVIGLLPKTVPGVIGVIPGVIDTLPQVIAPLLPSVPLPPGTVMAPPAVRAAHPPVAPPAVGVTTAVSDWPHSTSVPRHRTSATAAVPLAASRFGPGSAPADPPTNRPFAGAQQAGGASGGSGHPHAVVAGPAASGDYRLLFTRPPGETDHVGLVPGVPALPG